ncbi:hypothetical protein FB451DRAFT_1178728 [Mycena latifolia]|nr:hypothetical protein FB451DRAFT_1178728 [Mycena latifolia]
MDQIPPLLPLLANPRLDINFTVEVLLTAGHHPISDPELLIAKAVNQLANLNDASLSSKFYNVAGGYYDDRTDDLARSLQFFDKALGLAKNCATVEEARVLNSIARTKCSIGQYSAAQMRAHEAQRRAQMCGNLYQEALALETEAVCCLRKGNPKAAIALCQQGRQLVQLCGMHGGQTDHSIMITVANAHGAKSEYAEARNILASLAEKTSVSQSPVKYASSLINMAVIDLVTAKPEAEVYFKIEKAKEIFTAICHPCAIELCRMVSADLKLRQGNIAEAKILFQEGVNSRWGDADTVNYVLERLADVSCWPSDEITLSSRWAVVYLVYAKKLQRKVELYTALQFLGDGLMVQGDKDTAQSLFEVALEAFTEMDIHHRRADCMLRLGDISKQRGDLIKAVRLWKDARPLFERSSQGYEVAKIDTRLAAVDANTLQQ